MTTVWRKVLVWGLAGLGVLTGSGVAAAHAREPAPAQATGASDPAPGRPARAGGPAPQHPADADGSANADADEVDLAHHGRVVYQRGQLTVHLRTWNHGPSSLDSATVRLSFSAPVTGKLPGTCARQAPAVLHCETGALRAGAAASRGLDLALRVPGAPDEVWVDVRTTRLGQSAAPTTRDLNPANDHQRVLALATGDPYYF
ncbi:hypothetical protein [Streptomyces cremeus]|uniref:Uncharacterized protein n=1 Tax=Streptomyces cremeus TaxID=66881 RepID=A0ABV5PGM4_STRCM